MKRKIAFSTLTVLVILMALSLALLLPSGAITEEARILRTPEYTFDEDAALPRPAAVLASAVFSDILPAENINSLPIDLFAPGAAPIAENFTESGYRDDSIIVELEQKRIYDSDVYIAYIKIATPSQLRTAIAGSKLGSSRSNTTTKIGAAYNAIVAINGDFYKDTKAGFIVREGQTYREITSKNMDLLLIDELGDFHILTRGHESQAHDIKAFLSEHEIINGFMFGPGLVIHGDVCEIPSNYQWNPTHKEPRAAIGQITDLTYVMVVVNGRQDTSDGVTMAQLADIMSQLNCEEAYNLDGGNSATLAYNGQVFNTKPQSERSIYDIIYFASATGQD